MENLCDKCVNRMEFDYTNDFNPNENVITNIFCSKINWSLANNTISRCNHFNSNEVKGCTNDEIIYNNDTSEGLFLTKSEILKIIDK